jgi:hypothetical protein
MDMRLAANWQKTKPTGKQLLRSLTDRSIK